MKVLNIKYNLTFPISTKFVFNDENELFKNNILFSYYAEKFF